jgi:hypothetical protein
MHVKDVGLRESLTVPITLVPHLSCISPLLRLLTNPLIQFVEATIERALDIPELSSTRNIVYGRAFFVPIDPTIRLATKHVYDLLCGSIAKRKSPQQI